MPSRHFAVPARRPAARASSGRAAAVPILVACALSLIAFAARASDLFSTPHAAMLGLHPTSVVAGDVNGDGRAELVVANEAGNTLSVLRLDGSGRYSSWIEVPVQPNPSSLLLCNLDGDDRPDLLVAHARSGRIEAMLGYGESEFVTVNLIPTDGITGELVTADFDGNGAWDAAAVMRGQDAVVVVLRSADPDSAVWWLGQPDYFWAGPRPHSVAAGDLDGDGHPDLVAADSAARVVALLHGRGDGTFADPVFLATAAHPQAVRIGDVDEDGHPDIVATNDSLSIVSVFRGMGDGTFAPRRDQSFSGDWLDMHSLVLADLNADGHLDVAFAVDHYMVIPIRYCAQVLVGYGVGNGTFRLGMPVTFPGVTEPSGDPTTIAACELNGDGRADLIGTFCGYPCATSAGAVFTIEQAWNRAYGEARFPAGGSVGDLALADLDDDGRLDAITANYDQRSASVLRGLGDARFGAPVTYATGARPVGVATGDLDADGHLDVVVASDSAGAVSIWMGAPGGVLERRHDVDCGPSPRCPTLVDLDGDHVLDLVVLNVRDSSMSVLRGAPDGSFAPRVATRTAAYPMALRIADMNGDGVPDAVVGAQVSIGVHVAVLLGDGTGGFAASDHDWGGQQVLALEVTDFDEDGIPDIAVLFSNGFAILRGRGDGTFSILTSGMPACGNLTGFVVGDVDGYGHVDLLIGEDNGWCDGLSVLRGDGRRTMSAGGEYRLEWPQLFAGLLVDLNGDLLPELVRPAGYGGIGVLANQFTRGTLGVAADRPRISRPLALGAPWPNPTNGSCEIRFALPALSIVDVSIHDLAGRRVRALLAGQRCAAGERRLVWDGTDTSGVRVAPGLYFVRVRTPDGTVARSVVRLP